MQFMQSICFFFYKAYEDATTSEAFKKGKEVTEEVCIIIIINLIARKVSRFLRF